MKKILFAIFVSFVAGTGALSQDTGDRSQPKSTTVSESKAAPSSPAKTRKPIFRPSKDQIRQAQALLKERSLYSGEATGIYNKETRAGIRHFQKENELNETGTLNRATLEKMDIELTDVQRSIPGPGNASAVKTSSRKKPDPAGEVSRSKRPAIFRATPDQIKEAQRFLKTRSIYDGEETGKLDEATRTALKKYQEASSLKPTATLNQVTLESMGIALTDKQKGPAEPPK